MSKRSDWIGAVIAALAMTTLAPGFAWSQSIWLPRAVSGRVLLTEEGPPLSERMENQLEIHADFGAGKLRPGLDVHFPLGDLREISPLVLGINFAFIL